jgi:Kef-type K+ transport system membrane component KefB
MDLAHAAHVLGDRITQGPTLAFLILTLALILGPRLAEKVRLPAMVGLVLAGMVLGPHGFKLLAGDKIALSALGDFGLLYLMFAAGLELDLKRFARMRKAAMTFAALSFVIPFSLGLVSAKFLGYAWAAAVLMGSNWGSHTLVTYPMLRKMGLARNPAVATVVGATAVTDTSALLVLAGVSGSMKKTGGLGLQGAEIAVGLVVLVVWSILVLPKLARWFFARVGADRAYRYVFTLAAFLAGAVLAEAAGIDGIVGAFFAGLGLNRAIPERSVLMERIQFMGSSLFIPIFLVSVGVLLDPKVMIDPKTLLYAAIFTVAVLGGKSLAAVLAGRRFRFSWPEVGVMAGLSGSQAAATLATTLVGAKLGLFDTLTINAVLVVILASLVVTPALVSFFGKKVTRGQGAEEALGGAVLVPVWGESTRPLLTLAGRLAADDSGMVTAASFAAEDASEEQLTAQRSLKDKADEWLAADGLEANAIFRVSRSVEAGLLQTLRGEGSTLLLAEWHFEGLDPETEAGQMVAHSPVPILLVHGAIEPFERILLIARKEDLVRPGALDLGIAAQLTGRLARGRQVGYVGTSRGPLDALFGPKLQIESIESDDPLAWVKDNARSTDLVVFAGMDGAREAMARIPELEHGRFLVAIAAQGDGVGREDRSVGWAVGPTMPEQPGQFQ